LFLEFPRLQRYRGRQENCGTKKVIRRRNLVSTNFAAALMAKDLADTLSGRETPSRSSTTEKGRSSGPNRNRDFSQPWPQKTHHSADNVEHWFHTGPSAQPFPFAEFGLLVPTHVTCFQSLVSLRQTSANSNKISRLSAILLDISTAGVTIRYHLRSASGSSGSGAKESSPLLGIGPILFFTATISNLPQQMLPIE
jgi:hypothetical protein